MVLHSGNLFYLLYGASKDDSFFLGNKEPFHLIYAFQNKVSLQNLVTLRRFVGLHFVGNYLPIPSIQRNTSARKRLVSTVLTWCNNKRSSLLILSEFKRIN